MLWVLALHFYNLNCDFIFFTFWVTTGDGQGYFWLCTQELLLAVLGGPYGMPGIEPGSAACKANALPAVLSLWPQPQVFLSKKKKCPRVPSMRKIDTLAPTVISLRNGRGQQRASLGQSWRTPRCPGSATGTTSVPALTLTQRWLHAAPRPGDTFSLAGGWREGQRGGR